ncbi:hypothetical protein DGo_CA1301 [Deinococcus gobiensis I-0]|uniref:Uncharacterized protein n=1 Tax=Deinococcus gobiensis (strain DSM 21396 / JCM 16679 / CGMCC 1.7299 / I-0) TaxID=745776 RepID=H8GSF5_DEIGI|nr:hypothetical protein DGo_CA1301 [Deinococcus gobiensis I-0]
MWTAAQLTRPDVQRRSSWKCDGLDPAPARTCRPSVPAVSSIRCARPGPAQEFGEGVAGAPWAWGL